MTAGYQTLKAKGNEKVTVRGDKHGLRNVEVSADQVVKALESVSIAVASKDVRRQHERGQIYTPSAEYDRSLWRITFYPSGMKQGNFAQKRSFVHEGLHGVPYLGIWDRKPNAHQTPFREAAEELLWPSP